MKKAALALAVITLSILILAAPRALAATAKVKIEPSSLEVGPPPVNFLLNITVEDVELMAGFQISIKFNAAILQCQNVTLPPDFVYAGQNYLETDKIIDNTAGSVLYAVATFPFYRFNGSGVLCQLNFTGIAFDGADITIVTPEMGQTFYTQLLTETADEIPYTAVNGSVTVIPEFPPVFMLLALVTLTTAIAIKSRVKPAKL